MVTLALHPFCYFNYHFYNLSALNFQHEKHWFLDTKPCRTAAADTPLPVCLATKVF